MYWEAILYLPDREIGLHNFNLAKSPTLQVEETEAEGVRRWLPLDFLDIDMRNMLVEERQYFWNYLNKFYFCQSFDKENKDCQITIILRLIDDEYKTIEEWKLISAYIEKVDFHDFDNSRKIKMTLIFEEAQRVKS